MSGNQAYHNSLYYNIQKSSHGQQGKSYGYKQDVTGFEAPAVGNTQIGKSVQGSQSWGCAE